VKIEDSLSLAHGSTIALEQGSDLTRKASPEGERGREAGRYHSPVKIEEDLAWGVGPL
jgi:hypothetical protein